MVLLVLEASAEEAVFAADEVFGKPAVRTVLAVGQEATVVAV